MSDREEFEKWSELYIGWNDPDLMRDNEDPGSYLMTVTQHAWMAWQAARSPLTEAFLKRNAADYIEAWLLGGPELGDLEGYVKRLRYESGNSQQGEMVCADCGMSFESQLCKGGHEDLCNYVVRKGETTKGSYQ